MTRAEPLLARLRPSPGTGRSVVAGLLAAATGVAVGELVGGLLPSAGSPVVAVGGEVIDRAPKAMKDFAIETFGTNDKPALIIGTLVLLLLLGAGLGPLARRRPRIAVAIAVAVASLGVIATMRQESIGLLGAVWPSLLGGAAAVAVILVLRTPPVERPAADTPSDDDTDAGPIDGMPPRRQFLLAASTTAVLAAAAGGAGRVLAGRSQARASRDALRLPAPVERGPEITHAIAPDPTGISTFITPNNAFYRIDTALRVPDLTTDTYRLRVHGMVDRELDISWDDLIGRDLREYDITLTCVSNQIGDKLVGNARWLGFPLRDLLDEAGVDDGVDQIVGRSQDGYTGGFPLEAAYDRDAIVAVGMNGEPLPLIHGFPVRLVTPGIYGYLSAIKWLTEIELTTFAAFDSYWVPRGYAEQAPIKTMSRIDTPRSLAQRDPGPMVIGGVAWAQTRGIAKVEVRIDGGEWQEAQLSEALNEDTWRQWTLEWEAEPGSHTIIVRATDGDGVTQPEERSEPLPDGATGWHTVRTIIRER